LGHQHEPPPPTPWTGIKKKEKRKKGKDRKTLFRKQPTPKEASMPEKPDITFEKVKTPKTSMPAKKELGFHPPHPTGKIDAHIIGLRQEPGSC
jgi:hypothetical protein